MPSWERGLLRPMMGIQVPLGLLTLFPVPHSRLLWEGSRHPCVLWASEPSPTALVASTRSCWRLETVTCILVGDAPSTWHGVDAPSMFAELNWIESLSMSVMVSSSGSRHSLHRLCFHCSASLLSSGQPRGVLLALKPSTLRSPCCPFYPWTT